MPGWTGEEAGCRSSTGCSTPTGPTAGCLPIDLLRAKLAFFGAGKFDPKSDRWTRITLFQGAPLPEELQEDADHWCFAATADGCDDASCR